MSESKMPSLKVRVIHICAKDVFRTLCLVWLFVFLAGCQEQKTVDPVLSTIPPTGNSVPGDAALVTETAALSIADDLLLTQTPEITLEAPTAASAATRIPLEAGVLLFDVGKPVQAVVWTMDSMYLFSGVKDTGLVVLDPKEQSLIGITGTAVDIVALAVHPRSSHLAVADGKDGSIKLIDNGTGLPALTFSPANTAAPKKIVFDRYGDRMVSCGLDGKVYLWDVQTGTLIQTLIEGSNCTDLVFSKSGLLLVAGFGDEEVVRIWNTENWEIIFSFPVDEVEDLAINPNGTRIVTAPGTKYVDAHVWNLYTGNLLLTLPDQQAGVRSVAFSPDGKWIVSASSGEFVYFWDAQTGELEYELQADMEIITSLVFSPDGTMLAAAGNSIRVWYLTELGLAEAKE